MSDFAEQLASHAEEFLQRRTPYCHRGVTLNGCDCTGILIGCLRKMGFAKKYKLREYPRDWNLHAGSGDYIQEEVRQFASVIPNNQTRRGDLVLFRFGKCVAHLGIMVSDRTFVHSYMTSGCCVKSVLKGQTPWSKRWVVSYRLDEKKLRKIS